jgi:hypothetical protein
VSQVTEGLLSKHEALSSNPRTAKKGQTKNQKKKNPSTKDFMPLYIILLKF